MEIRFGMQGRIRFKRVCRYRQRSLDQVLGVIGTIVLVRRYEIKRGMFANTFYTQFRVDWS